METGSSSLHQRFPNLKNGTPIRERRKTTGPGQWIRPIALKSKDEKPKSEDKKPNDIKVITRLRYRMDGQGYFGDLRRHVFWVKVPKEPPGDAEEAATLLTMGDYDHSLPDITPDGRYAVLSALRRDDADYHTKSDLWLFEVESRKAVLLYDAPGPAHGPRISPDGRYVSFFGHDRARNVSTRTDLYILPVADFLEAASREEAPGPLTAKDAVNVTGHLDRAAGSMGGSEPRFGEAEASFGKAPTPTSLLWTTGRRSSTGLPETPEEPERAGGLTTYLGVRDGPWEDSISGRASWPSSHPPPRLPRTYSS